MTLSVTLNRQSKAAAEHESVEKSGGCQPLGRRVRGPTAEAIQYICRCDARSSQVSAILRDSREPTNPDLIRHATDR